jgi:superoxide reductase
MAKFYRCKVCGNIVGLIKEGGGTLTCCGEPMEEIIPNTQEGVATEKHIPLVHEENGKVYVQVGSRPSSDGGRPLHRVDLSS